MKSFRILGSHTGVVLMCLAGAGVAGAAGCSSSAGGTGGDAGSEGGGGSSSGGASDGGGSGSGGSSGGSSGGGGADGSSTGSGSGSGGIDGGLCATTSAPSCAVGKLALSPPVTTTLSSNVTAIGVGDVNGDHKADVVVVDATSATPGFWVLLGKGDGTFGTPSSVSSTAVGNSVVVADFNGDCKADVLLPSLDNSTNMGSVELFLSNGDGTFQQSSSVDIAFDNSLSLVAGDFGGKGSLGFAITSVANPGIDVSVLGSTGMLSSPTLFHASDLSGLGPSSEVEGIAAGDLNGDGAADLVVATGSGPCVLMNGGSGQFSSAPVCYPASTGYTGDTVAIGDINGDRKADVVLGVGQSVTSGPSPIVVDIFSGKGDGTLGNPTTVQYTNGAFYDDVSLVDLNHDAMLDLIAYYGTGSSVEPSGFSVWMNSGTGTLPMMPTGQYGTPGGGPQAPAYGDFAGNGLMGMVAVNQVGTNFSINVISATCKP